MGWHGQEVVSTVKQCASNQLRASCYIPPLQVAVEVDDGDQQGYVATNAKQYAFARVRERVLQSHGWTVAKISGQRFMEVEDEHQRMHYLLEVLKEAVSKAAQSHHHHHHEGCGCSGHK